MQARRWIWRHLLHLPAVLMCAVMSGCAPARATPLPDPTPAYILPTASWIEVDLDKQLVRLHEGGSVIAEYGASSGVAEYPTPAGLYRVQQLEKGPIENVPGVWVSDIVVFDFGQGIGIHSMPMDVDGKVLDPTIGAPSSGGCVRVAESAEVFAFAQLGMRVWVH